VRRQLRFVFTENATVALNQAIKGVLRPGDHVVTTSVEHNSVMRPLRRMEEAGVRVTVVPAGNDGVTEAREVIGAFRKATRLVVMVARLERFGGAAAGGHRRRGGAPPRDPDADRRRPVGGVRADRLSSLPVDLLAASGHKGFSGLRGPGFFSSGRGCRSSL